MEVFCNDGKQAIWEVVDGDAVEEATNNDEIGLRGFDFKTFGKDEKGVGREESSEFTYFTNVNEPMAWGLESLVKEYEQECG